MTFDPRTVADPERALAEIATALHLGSGAFHARLDELGAGYPSAGGGGTGNAAGGGPTLAAVIARLDERRPDVAAQERAAWERDLHKALEHAGALWARYQRITHTRLGVEKLTDPGCELCAKIPCGCDRCSALSAPHWCAARYTVDHEEPAKPGRKGQAPTKRKLALCSSCYAFQRPDRFGRLPDHGEVLDHAEGRRRRRRAS